MAIDLKGRAIAITGAGSGIGLATAMACSRAGMSVALAGRRLDKIEDAVRKIKSEGGRAIAVQVDVTNPDQCARLINDTVAAFGSIYAVYANAGYGYEKRVHESSDQEIRDIFETNFYGSLNVIRPALKHMLRAQSGHVLMCSSCLSKIGVPYMCAYSATKAAQDHFGRGMRAELRGTGVHISTVHPVRTTSEFFDGVAKSSGGTRVYSRGSNTFVQSAETVANATVRCLRRPRGEVWTSTRMRLMLALATAFPSLADRAVGRYGKK
jgi:short-subunit dehydrogenase